ncbi:MAG: ABC transporter ATP-binding protein [Lachnospiraceae bacterium]|nr:ABC transporter ATP-binding protein [Lachnospiraceae bacterium]
MIEVSHLTKRYGSHTAVSDLSFTITPGKIYGFLGPNGAGKSTTMNIITGCLAATSGDVKIGGYDIFEQAKEAKKLVGYLPELPPLYVEQTAREYLHFVARAKGLKKQDIASEMEKVIEETHIEDVSDKLIKHLSKGYRQRVGIAQALLGNPEIIILDEPTVGLDPAQIIEIRELIKKLGESHTVILSSHILSEIQAICDEVLIIHKGKLVAFDKPENLSHALSGGNTIELCCEASADEMTQLLLDINKITDITVTEENGETCSAVLTVGEADPKAICREIFLAFSRSGKILQQMNPVSATLEDIFIEITGDNSKESNEEEENEEENDEENYEENKEE